MTFFEAAVEILRKSGRPLHYKKITELAVSEKLLSHIGKTPEVTMVARLRLEASKGEEASIRRVRPGVFCLVDGVSPSTLRETTRARTPSEGNGDVQDTGGRAGTWTPTHWSAFGQGVAEAVPNPTEPAPAGHSQGDGKPSLVVGGRSQRVEPSETRKGGRVAPPTPADRNAEHPSESVAALCALAAQGLNGHPILALRRATLARPGAGSLPMEQSVRGPLGKAHEALEAAHAGLVERTAGELSGAIERLSSAEQDAFVEATLDGLGFATRKVKQTGDCTHFEASTPVLATLRVALWVWRGAQPVTGELVAALRESLKSHNASHGAIVAMRRAIRDSARLEAGQVPGPPVVLVDTAFLASLALSVGVGVTRYTLEVPVLDDRWFGHPPAR